MAIFARAWRLFRENPIVAVPNVLLQAFALTMLFAQQLFEGHLRDARWTVGIAGFDLLWVGGYFVLGVFLTAAAYGMGAAAWQRDLVTYADGVAAGIRRWWKLAQAFLLLFGLSIPLAFAVILAILAAVPSEAQQRAFFAHPPAGVVAAFTAAALVLWFLGVYIIPAIVVGRRNVLEGIAGAVRLSLGCARETAAMLFPIAVVGGLLILASEPVSAAIANQPGWMIAAVVVADAMVGALASTYVTLVVVGQFLHLGGTHGHAGAEAVVARYE